MPEQPFSPAPAEQSAPVHTPPDLPPRTTPPEFPGLKSAPAPGKEATLNATRMGWITTAEVGFAVAVDEMNSAANDIHYTQLVGASAVAANLASWAVTKYNFAPEKARKVIVGVAAALGGLVAGYNSVKYSSGDTGDAVFYASTAMGLATGAGVGMGASVGNVEYVEPFVPRWSKEQSDYPADDDSNADATTANGNDARSAVEGDEFISRNGVVVRHDPYQPDNLADVQVPWASQREGAGNGRATVSYGEASAADYPEHNELPTHVVPLDLEGDPENDAYLRYTADPDEFTDMGASLSTLPLAPVRLDQPPVLSAAAADLPVSPATAPDAWPAPTQAWPARGTEAPTPPSWPLPQGTASAFSALEVSPREVATVTEAPAGQRADLGTYLPGENTETAIFEVPLAHRIPTELIEHLEIGAQNEEPGRHRSSD